MGKKQRKRCQKSLDEWLYKLGLLWWDCEIIYRKKAKHFRKANGNVAIMRCYADWRYMRLTLEVNLTQVRRLDDIELERVIVHELCHALVNEMREIDPGIKHEERVVTMLTKAFIWTRNITRDGKQATVACNDCGLEYGAPGWIEAIVPDDIWKIITPNKKHWRGGILCITCISKRCEEHRLENVPILLCGTEPLRAVLSRNDLVWRRDG
jgi:hypothetical protein